MILNNEYKIKTLQDMLEKIPIEKFDKFLNEFIEQIKIAKVTYDLLDVIEKDFTNNFEMIWTDDNKKNINIKISSSENINESATK